jgi:hypothetical protein
MQTIRKLILAIFAVAIEGLLLPAGCAHAQQFNAKLSEFEETLLTILRPATGALTLYLDIPSSTITYKLSYSALSSPPTQAHIHFGEPGISGFVIAFLCTNMNNVPAGIPPAPACPSPPASISGTLTGANILSGSAQGVPANDFSALVTILTSGAVYGNVDSILHPSGEIRGPLQSQNQ